MLSFLRLRCSSFSTIYQTSVKCAHRSSGFGPRRHVPSKLYHPEYENEHSMDDMTNNVEEMEDDYNSNERDASKPDLAARNARERERLRKKVVKQIIERKYFKKPQEINLLTWDTKEQIRFLHNEYPDEWTIERLANSFPLSQEGVIKILKSHFCPKSLEEIVKHDKRVQKNWNELKDGKEKNLLGSGPAMSRYEELLKNAAGNPSLPMPDLKKLLLSSGRKEEQKAGTFLSIIKDYCDKKDAVLDTRVSKDVKSAKSDPAKLLSEHVAHNRMLIEGIVEKSPKHSKFSKNSEDKYSELSSTIKSQMLSLKEHSERANVQREKAAKRSGQLINSNFDSSFGDEDSLDLQDPFDLAPEMSHRGQNRRLAKVPSAKEMVADSELSDAGLRGTEKLSISDEVFEKMEANSQLGFDNETHSSRKVASDRKQEALNNMVLASDEEFYMYSETEGYQYPFGRMKDLPDERIPVEPNKPMSGTVYRKESDVYDEDGEFLYRTP